MQTNPVWRMVRALIVTYILSGILLAVLSFALFKFRLPENQVNVAVCAVYVISCFFGGILAGKTMRTRRFFWYIAAASFCRLVLSRRNADRSSKTVFTPVSSSFIARERLG